MPYLWAAGLIYFGMHDLALCAAAWTVAVLGLRVWVEPIITAFVALLVVRDLESQESRIDSNLQMVIEYQILGQP